MPEVMPRRRIILGALGLGLSGNAAGVIINQLQTLTAISNINAQRSLTLKKQSLDTVDKATLGKELAAMSPRISAQTLDKPKVGGVEFQPSVNTDVVAAAMLAVAQVKGGNDGRFAVAKAVTQRGVYLKVAGTATPQEIQAQNRIVIEMPTDTVTANFVQHEPGVTPHDDFAVLQSIDRTVTTLIPGLSVPALPLDPLAAETNEISEAAALALATTVVGSARSSKYDTCCCSFCNIPWFELCR